MSPRDRFDDGPDDGRGWQEPAHLGRDDDGAAREPEGAGPTRDDEEIDRPNFADRRRHPREDISAPGWEPPGWSMPPADPSTRPAPPPSAEHPEEPPPATGQPVPPPSDRTGPPYPDPSPAGQPGTPPPGSGWGAGRPRGAAAEVFRDQGDPFGTQAWAAHHGWTVSDGSAPQDAVLAELIASAPVQRASRDHRPGNVLRGRADTLDLVAFDVVYASGGYLVPQYAITAAPLLLPLPYLRLSPARFWRHRTGGLVPVPTGDAEFDARWVLLTAEDGEPVRRLAADATVRGLLLGTDDGDEFWAAAGHVAAIRPDAHRPLLVEHHARMLTAVVRAVTGGA
ncbi:hypothetical protein OF117_18035 [Geodermatophilus sp. YIM 151500]|uniref:hypothetical protein n=1 Tax=Geodermatophilus sp. YIM 151500 TaxID=2984531 RepID=UPI0021E407A4|nr:hypothetical protein [Geodermatophilus sp. YIM 151500]MCV2491250.1 hypothetical protein [Geodermatophilus sp. YIM 151500]